MTIGLSNALAQQQTQKLVDTFSGGFIRIFSGTRPADASAAEAGTLLGEVSVNGLSGAGLHFTADGTVLAKATEQWVFKALAAGPATWFRIVQAGDTGLDDSTAKRLDGDVGTPSAPGDMTWQSTTLVPGAHYTIDSFLYVINPIGT